MPHFEAFETVPVPSIDFGDESLSDLTKQHNAMLALQAIAEHTQPAVVLRGANLQHERDCPPNILPIATGSLAVGRCVSIMTFDRQATTDVGLHRDPRALNLSNKPPRMNFHTSLHGRSVAQFLVPLPGINPDTLPDFQKGDAADIEYTEALDEGQVDTSLFQPRCFETNLDAGDTVAFYDWYTPHLFATVIEPRSYSSGLYEIHTPATP